MRVVLDRDGVSATFLSHGGNQRSDRTEVPWPSNVLVSASVWHVRTHGDLLTRTASQVSHMQANSIGQLRAPPLSNLIAGCPTKIPTFWSRTDSVDEQRGGTDFRFDDLPADITRRQSFVDLVERALVVADLFDEPGGVRVHVAAIAESATLHVGWSDLCLGILFRHFFDPSGSWLILGIMPGIGFLVLTGLVYLILKRQEKNVVVVLPSVARVSALSSSQPQTSWWRSWLAKLLPVAYQPLCR